MRNIYPNKLAKCVFAGICLSILFIVITGYSKHHASLEGLRLPSGEVLGGDFIAFYTGGSLMRQAPDSLYDLETQFNYQIKVSEIEKETYIFLPYVYPPLVATILSPLSHLPFAVAYTAFTICSLLLFILGTESLLRTHGTKPGWEHRALVYLAFLSFTPLSVKTLAGGQLSIFGFFLICFAAFLLSRRRDFQAGLLLCCAYYKPPLFLFLGAASFILGSSKMRSGLVLGSMGVISLELLVNGPSLLQDYLGMLVNYGTGAVEQLGNQVPASKHIGMFANLSRFFNADTSMAALILLSALFILVFYRNRSKTFYIGEYKVPAQFLAISATSLFLAIHINLYDLTLALPAAYICFFLSRGANFSGLIISFGILALFFVISAGILSPNLLLPLLLILMFAAFNENQKKNFLESIKKDA